MLGFWSSVRFKCSSTSFLLT